VYVVPWKTSGGTAILAVFHGLEARATESDKLLSKEALIKGLHAL